MTQQPLIIKDWQSGIADSPHIGFGLQQAVQIDAYTGGVRPTMQPVSNFTTAFALTFTADASTDICTIVGGTVPTTDTAVTVSNSGGALPAGLSAGTIYFIIKLSSSTFKLATTIANAEAGTGINITDNGTGTQTVTTVNPGTIMHYAYDPNTGTRFQQDSNGRVWYSSGTRYLLLNGNTLTSAAGNGMTVFRVSDGSATYLFAFRNQAIDVVNVFGASQLQAPSWTNGWQSVTNGTHYALVGQDNIIYFANSRTVGSIQEKPGSVFDPSSGGTYTYNTAAVTLPIGSVTYWMEQLGVNLLIGVSNDAYIYPWDRSSVSYGLPLPVADYGINKMKNIGNVVYILAGTHGNIYWTQGTYVKLFKPIPTYLLNNSTTVLSNPVTWGGISSVLGKLLVGVGAFSGKSGVYAITPDGILTLDNYPSTGQANVTALYAQNEFYEMGYAGGSDQMDSSRYASLGAPVLQSALYRLADKTSKTKFSQVEVQIADGVAATVEVSYRRNLTSAFTTLATFTTDTSNTSYQQDIGITDIENFQVQVRLAGNVQLMEVRFKP